MARADLTVAADNLAGLKSEVDPLELELAEIRTLLAQANLDQA